MKAAPLLHRKSVAFVLLWVQIKEEVTMNEYIERLVRCGIAIHDAVRLYYSFIREFGITALEEYLVSLEGDSYVAGIEFEPNLTASR